MLAPPATSRPATPIGSAIAARMRSAVAVASPTSTSSSSTVNSSPPNRATVSPVQAGHEPPGNGDQLLVADLVAEAVVDDLEPVEVEEQHADAPPVRASPPQGGLEQVGEPGAVGQSGQRVVEGLMGQPGLRLPALGDVAGVDDDPADARVGQEVGDRGLDPAPRAVSVAGAVVDGRLRPRPCPPPRRRRAGPAARHRGGARARTPCRSGPRAGSRAPARWPGSRSGACRRHRGRRRCRRRAGPASGSGPRLRLARRRAAPARSRR